VVLAEIRDPGNAGTVLRTADAAGADAVILSERSVNAYNGRCVRASAGSCSTWAWCATPSRCRR
jgi:TrmH family RNA methyltransferase